MKKYLILTLLLGVFTIILGAFGAHALQEKLTDSQMKSFETGVRYQMYHTIVLLLILLTDYFSLKAKRTTSILLILGIIFFSGSIYAINLFEIPAKSIWFVTPLGGLFFIIGWSSLVYYTIKMQQPEH